MHSVMVKKKEKKTPSVLTLVPCKPHFHYTIHAATGHDFSWKKKGSVYSTKEVRQPLRNRNRERHRCPRPLYSGNSGTNWINVQGCTVPIPDAVRRATTKGWLQFRCVKRDVNTHEVLWVDMNPLAVSSCIMNRKRKTVGWEVFSQALPKTFTTTLSHFCSRLFHKPLVENKFWFLL